MQRTARSLIPLVMPACLAACALTACSSSSGSDHADGKVTITVQGMPATSDKAGRATFLAQIAAFEKANPDIKVVGSDAVWDPQTFATRLAGGSAETVVRVPLTEPAGLIAKRQVQDISAELKAWPQYTQYDQRLIAPAKDSSGKVYGLTDSQYAMGLNYNRALFKKAGLDPDKPPTTWDEVRQDAKTIHEKTGAVGYAETTTQNGGGWHLTSYTYSRGGTMEKSEGGKQKAAFDDQPTKDALQLLHDMRWTDNSMGTTELQGQLDVWRKFGAGKVGMYIDGPSAIVPMVQQYGLNKEDFGAAAMPQAGGNATQIGGTVEMITAKASAAQRAAAVKWILFEYIKPMYDPAQAAAGAKLAAADPKQLVGVPGLPAFNQAVQDKVNAAIKPYANVPSANFQPYLDGSAKLDLKPEPPVAAQKLYGDLDPVVQAVLTNKNADIDSLLSGAAKQVQSDIDSAQS